MKEDDVIEQLVDHYKNNLEDAEVVFEDLCGNDELPVFNLPAIEIQLNAHQKNELIRRFSEEIMPMVGDSKRIR